MTDLTVWEMRKADMWCVMRVRVGSEESVRLQCQKKLSSDLLKGCYVFYYQEKKHKPESSQAYHPDDFNNGTDQKYPQPQPN